VLFRSARTVLASAVATAALLGGATAIAPSAHADSLSVQAYTCHMSYSGGRAYGGHYSGNTVVPARTAVTSAGIEAQCLLSSYGAGTVDGIFGPRSQAAMHNAQEDINLWYGHKVTVDGMPGPESWPWLRKLINDQHL
jgi:peptidoglycan hydrolase-like protein with peptidoglycan-binding domain